MNFSPYAKSWIILVCIVLSVGCGAGYTAFLTGSTIVGSVIVGLGAAASNILTNLMKSPGDKATAEAAKTAAPFSSTTNPTKS